MSTKYVGMDESWSDNLTSVDAASGRIGFKMRGPTGTLSEGAFIPQSSYANKISIDASGRAFGPRAIPPHGTCMPTCKEGFVLDDRSVASCLIIRLILHHERGRVNVNIMGM